MSGIQHRRLVSILVLAFLSTNGLIHVTSGAKAGERGANEGQTSTAGEPNNPGRGETYYGRYGCWECHGYKGMTGSAPGLAVMELNLRGFIAYVRKPRGTPPYTVRNMPPYTEKVISDAQLSDIFAYIKTFAKPKEAKDIPLLRQILEEK